MKRQLVMAAAICTAAAACQRGGTAPAAPAAHEHEKLPAERNTPDPHAGHTMAPGFASVDVEPARQQLLGIKTAPVVRQRIDKSIRTVGIVQADETRASHVHVKFEGFIEKVYADFVGRSVRKGQPLFQIFSRELLAAEQEYLSSRAALARIPATGSETVRAPTQQLVSAARERLRLFDVPPAVLAQMERTEVAPRTVTILSPQTGVIVEKQAIEGLAVTPMMHLYVIADLSRVWVVADVYERDLARVATRQQARMQIEALPGRAFDGTVTFVSPTVDQTTRTVKVRFEFPNRDAALRPGMYATVEILTPAGEGLVVASDSVIDTGERKIVFVAQGEGRFDPRLIVTGVAFDGHYQVLEGLHEGEVIATTGQFLLDSESRIRGARTGGALQHGGH